jgi:hypothetical protein
VHGRVTSIVDVNLNLCEAEDDQDSADLIFASIRYERSLLVLFFYFVKLVAELIVILCQWNLIADKIQSPAEIVRNAFPKKGITLETS